MPNTMTGREEVTITWHPDSSDVTLFGTVYQFGHNLGSGHNRKISNVTDGAATRQAENSVK